MIASDTIPYRILDWVNAINYLAWLHSDKGKLDARNEFYLSTLLKYSPESFTTKSIGYPIACARRDMLAECYPFDHGAITSTNELLDVIEDIKDTLSGIGTFQYVPFDPKMLGMIMRTRHLQGALPKWTYYDFHNLQCIRITLLAPDAVNLTSYKPYCHSSLLNESLDELFNERLSHRELDSLIDDVIHNLENWAVDLTGVYLATDDDGPCYHVTVTNFLPHHKESST